MSSEWPEEKQLVIVRIPEGGYVDALVKLIKLAAERSEKTCYVSLNRPSSVLIKLFEQYGVDPAKFFIVDAITQTVAPTGPADGIAFVSSPSALTELGISVSDAYQEHKFDLMLFDSISTLMAHSSPFEVLRFAHILTARLRSFECGAIFPVLRGDMDSVVVRDLEMFTDGTIDLSVSEPVAEYEPEEVGGKKSGVVEAYRDMLTPAARGVKLSKKTVKPFKKGKAKEE